MVTRSDREAHRVKRVFGILALIAIALAVVSFFTAPVVTFFGIRSAAQANDIAGLQRLIDFDAVRASLRPQIATRPQALTPPPSFMTDPIEAFRRRFEVTVAPKGPDPDDYLTPDAIEALMSGQGRSASRTVATTPRGPAEARRAPWPSPRYWGVNIMRLAVTDDGGSDTVFTFERKGPYVWKLVHIGLPDSTATPLPETTR